MPTQIIGVDAARHLVDHEIKRGNAELAGNVDRDSRALEVLAVRAQDQQQNVADRDGEQGLLVQARVGVDDQVVELEILGQVAEAIVERADVVAFAQDSGDVAGLHARGHEVKRAAGGNRGGRGDDRGDVVSGVLDGHLAPEVVVQGVLEVI
jgi:hypothetical protein